MIFISIRFLLLIALITLIFSGGINLYTHSAINLMYSIFLGFLAYLLAYVASFLINYYPDPVKNKSLTSDKLAKIISRKFYRAMSFRYLIVFIGIFLLITNGFASLGVLLGWGWLLA